MASRSTRSTAPPRVTFTNTRRWTTITNVHAVFWSIRSAIVWSRYTGDSGCWTIPTRAAANNVTKVEGGRTYYAYRTNYTCAITPTHMGTTTLQPYNFVSQCYNLDDATWELARWVDRDAYATVNGVQRTFLINAFAIQGTG